MIYKFLGQGHKICDLFSTKKDDQSFDQSSNLEHIFCDFQ